MSITTGFTRDYGAEIVQKVLHWLISSVPLIIGLMVGAWVLVRAVDRLVQGLRLVFSRRFESGGMDAPEVNKRIDTLSSIIRGSLKVSIWFVAGLMILKELGIDIAPLLAGAGIAGLAVGFGAQNLVRDVISGVFILLEDQVRVGDVAIINGTDGLVESVGLRTIILRDIRGVVHTFPNGAITMVSNMTKDWSAAVFDIGVAYQENIDQVMEVIKQVGDSLYQDPTFKDLILEPLEVMGLENFGDNAVIVRARFKTQPKEQWNVGREFNRRIKIAFDAQGIEIPFPQRTVHVVGPKPV